MNDRIEITVGDITELKVDALVNAANERMLGGGGVDGAIHRAAGTALKEYCINLPEYRPNVRCPTGEARITPGFNLRASHIIHVVGPIYSEEAEERNEKLLKSCYREALKLAEENDITSIAFPCISTGVYRYPMDEAAEIATWSVQTWMRSHELPYKVVFCCFSEKAAKIYSDLLGIAVSS